MWTVWTQMQSDLEDYFSGRGLQVTIDLGPGDEGLVLRSRDERIDMANIGPVVASVKSVDQIEWEYPYE